MRATTTSEPQWTEHDQAVMLALAEYRDGLCPCCGLPKAMTQIAEAKAPSFIVTKRYCLARRTLIESQQSFTNNGKDTKPAHAALQWSIKVKS